MAATDPLLPCVEIEPSGEARAAVIWLHGLGADGHDFEPVVPHLGIPPDAGVRFVFPHAPSRPVTINFGMVMPAWYDVRDLDLETRPDEAGIRQASAWTEALLAREKDRGIPAQRILLAGFSQGGAIAMHTALRHPEPLAGLLALSSYLVLPALLERERDEANRAIPIFQAHGTHDPLVPAARGEEARDRLTALGYRVEWRTYPVQHEVCLEEIQDAGRWLATRLTAPSSPSG